MRYDPEKVCERIFRIYNQRDDVWKDPTPGIHADENMQCIGCVHGCSDGRIHGRWGSARKAGPPTAGSESLQCSAGVEAEESAGIHRDDCGL